MQSIELTNLALTTIYKLSETLTLEDQPSVSRRRFLRMLKPHIDDLSLEQSDVVRRYVDKEENGEPKQTKDKNYLFADKEKHGLYLKAWEKLNNSKFKIDVLDSNREFIKEMAKHLTEKIEEIEKKNEGKYISMIFDSIQDAKDAVEMLDFEKEREAKTENKKNNKQ